MIESNNTPAKFEVEEGIVSELSIAEAKAQLRECYERMVSIFDDYLDMPKEYYKFISVWTIGTYFHEQFNAYPYLFFNAMRGSGKTRSLKLISSLGAKGDGSIQNNLTEAVLFRIPRGTTTCIDEVEQIGSKEKQTLRELLNSAYKKGMKVKRMTKRKVEGQECQVTEVFEPYFPICMANIWGVDEVLGDRSIVLILEKSNDARRTKKIEDFDINANLLDLKVRLRKVSVVSVVSLRQKTYIQHWNDFINSKYTTNDITTTTTQTTQTTLQEIERNELFNKIDNLGISGRNFELLFPLLLVAQELGNDVFDEILQIGNKIIEGKKEDEYSESKDVSLFEFCCSAQLTQRGLNYIPIREITTGFRTFLGDTDDNEDRWLNEKWVGKALKRLGLILAKKREAAGRLVMINYAKAKEKLKIFKKEEIHEDF